MAITIPIITEFADKGIVAAQSSFSTFKNKIGEADGAMGKLKAGSGVAFDAIKANAGAMALGAGAAIAGFAVKAVGDFSKLALEVDKFRNTTGLTLDQSSEWVSYTGDLGIQAESMVKIFNRLGKAATDQLPAFKELGVEIAFGPDGAADLEATFLRVNDAINSLDDPVAQAKYRADLFGRGWMDAAELINMSSDEITTALGGVKDFEVIDEEEIQKAKDLRAAQDELGDALARLSVTLGEALIPAFTQATEAAKPFLDIMMPLVEAIGEGADANASYVEQASKNNVQMRTGIALADRFFRWLGIGNDETEDLTESTQQLEDAWKNGYRAMINATQAAEGLTEELISVDDALAELKGNVHERREWDNLIDAIDDAKEAAIDAFMEATPEALRASQRETDEARLKVAEYIREMDGIPEVKKTEMIAALDQANLAEIEAQFNYLARNRVSHIEVITTAREQAGTSSGMGSGRNQMGFGIRSSNAGNVVVNVAGSVIAEGDLVEKVRVGLVKSQRNGSPLVYSNQ